MMERTDRHYRFMMRQLTRRTLLYTEMVTQGAILHGDRARHLDFDPVEKPLALQLGGDDAAGLAACARIAEDWGYDEVNLNVGCPSPRVQRGAFGAALMAHPERVAEMVAAMRATCRLPVTVKHRIGIDGREAYEDLEGFVRAVKSAGPARMTVHARIACLDGLSPKENREVPPLRYDDVYRLKAAFPALEIEINGGVLNLEAGRAHLGRVDAVMIGRAAYADPWMFREADELFFGEAPRAIERAAVAETMQTYTERWVAQGGRTRDIGRHLLHLFSGTRGARVWRRHLTVHGAAPNASPRVIKEALQATSEVRH